MYRDLYVTVLNIAGRIPSSVSRCVRTLGFEALLVEDHAGRYHHNRVVSYRELDPSVRLQFHHPRLTKGCECVLTVPATLEVMAFPWMSVMWRDRVRVWSGSV